MKTTTRIDFKVNSRVSNIEDFKTNKVKKSLSELERYFDFRLF